MFWTLLSWFGDNWLLIPWGAGVVVAYIYGGKKLAIVVLTLGFGMVAYRKGASHERDNHEKRAKKINEDRENAYDEIDNRRTNRDNVLERLRDNDY